MSKYKAEPVSTIQTLDELDVTVPFLVEKLAYVPRNPNGTATFDVTELTVEVKMFCREFAQSQVLAELERWFDYKPNHLTLTARTPGRVDSLSLGSNFRKAYLNRLSVLRDRREDG